LATAAAAATIAAAAGWPIGEPGSLLPFIVLLVDVCSGVLLMMGSCPPGLQVPDVLGTVAAGHDERSEVGVVVMRAEAQRA